MKISYNWLKEYIKTDLPAEKVSEILTDIGLEVEGLEKVESVKGGLKGVVIGEVKSVKPHPNADRLKLTKVDVGHADLLDIVCGAPNVAEGQKVPVALVGSVLFMDGKEFKIKKSKIRGEASEGMLCAEDELGLGNSHDGILVLEKDAEVGEDLATYLNIEEDEVFEIGLTPNRVDAASHYGVARDLAAYLNLQDDVKAELPSVADFKVDSKDLQIDVKIEDPKACPRYSALTFTDVKVGESPDWLKRRLQSIGSKPINNVVDITNFILHEIGQPLHAFDADKIKGNEVIVKKLREGSKFTTLDEVERELSGDELMICNAKDGMCMAGVFGGIDSGVKDSTTSVFLESAYFNPVSIRKTAKFHALNTDASFRYERGADPNITVYALKRAAQLFKEVCGAKVASDILDIYPEPVEDFLVELNYENCDRLIGMNLHRSTIKEILENLEIKILNENKKGLRLQVPAYRVDVQREVDVIEEILRIHGLNAVPMPEQLRTSIGMNVDRTALKAEEKAANQLASIGFREILNNSLTNPEHYATNDQFVPILNPLSKELEVMRQTMLHGGLSAINWNLNRKRGNLRFFEFGKVYFKPSNDSYEEFRKLGIWLSGNRTEESWRAKEQAFDFYDLKSVCIEVIENLGINRYKIKEIKNDQFVYGIELMKGKNSLGILGKVSDAILEKFEIEEEVYFAELNWEVIIQQIPSGEIQYKPIAKFPSVRRDLALLIDKSISFEQIRTLARDTETTYLREVNLFDVYEGDKLEKGKQSYGVSFTFQDKGKTLTDQHVDKIMGRLIESFKKVLGAELR
ncbi:MAG: phenylalanine--tRNA ligase subunit beta [Flavobacteriales bacterium]|nr:phenylalanine--tRNA ligase subunit beta [Flavobacteriales bacterium]